jgi:DNA-binding NarL/FixJ family response regulator
VDLPVTRAEAFVASLSRCRPDVLLLDQSLLRTLDGETVTFLAAALPKARVLLLCDRPQPRVSRTVLQHQFHGYVSCGRDEVYGKAIRSVHRGELWLSRLDLAEAVYGRTPRRHGEKATGHQTSPRFVSSLTPREDQVTSYLRKGCSNKEIASELGIREDTVKKHLRNVFSKLGVRRRTQLLLMDKAAVPR